MKVNNVGLNLNHKIANPFKTSRNSTTNPFQNVSFEGNTLPFADVFEGFEPKKVSKVKMISSSIAGSVTKLRSRIPESIVNFVGRVSEGISNAWEYTFHKNLFNIPGEQTFRNVMGTDIKDIHKGMSEHLSGIGKGIISKTSAIKNFSIGESISNTMSILNYDVSKGISDKWNSIVGNLHKDKITKDTSVETLKEMWLKEISSTESEAA